MKKLFFALCLLLGTLTAFASTPDVDTSKGTDQLTIVNLSPSPGDERVSRYAAMEVEFNVPLDAAHIKEHDIKLTYLSSPTNEHVAGAISYNNAVLTFKPDSLLAPGMYEVEFKSLKTDSTTNELIYAIKYRFVVVEELLQSITIRPEPLDIKEGESVALTATGHYDNGMERDITPQALWNAGASAVASVDADATLRGVGEGATTLTAKLDNITGTANVTVYKEVNGHRLPPEPDPDVNNATLLGIDSNGNGVRDDVERYVILRFSQEEFPKTRTALAMQYAWAMQKIIESPTRESAKYSHDALDCQYYWFHQKQEAQKQHMYELHKTNRRAAFEISAEMGKWRLKYGVFNHGAIHNKIFNTRERTKREFAYNGAMSGGFYPGREKSLDNCQVNIDLFGE